MSVLRPRSRCVSSTGNHACAWQPRPFLTRPFRSSWSSPPIHVRSYDDPFKTLGVDHDADEKQVKKAYRKLALRYHPDVNKEDLAEVKFKALREAYELLLGKGTNAGGDSKRAPFGGNWETHDWYWTFSMRQRQRRQGGSQTTEHRASDAQVHKPAVHSQLANLKKRAARRKAARGSDVAAASMHVPPASASAARSIPVEAPTHISHTLHTPLSPDVHHHHHPAAPVSYTSHATNASDSAQQTPAVHVNAAAQEAPPVTTSPPQQRHTIHTSSGRHSSARSAISRLDDLLHTAVGRHANCFQEAVSHMRGLAAGQHVGRGVPRGAGSSFEGLFAFKSSGLDDDGASGMHTECAMRDSALAELEADFARGSYGSPELGAEEHRAQDDAPPQRRFVATEESKASVGAQLAGLRRKAKIKAHRRD